MIRTIRKKIILSAVIVLILFLKLTAFGATAPRITVPSETEVKRFTVFAY